MILIKKVWIKIYKFLAKTGFVFLQLSGMIIVAFFLVSLKLVKEEAKTIQLSYSKFNELLTKAIQTPDYQMTPSDYEKFQKICDYIDETFDITFGNRVMNQISTLVPAFIACGGQKEVVLDFLLARKILVKLEGRFEEYIKTGLKHLLTLIEKQYGNTFVKSEKIIQSLTRKL